MQILWKLIGMKLFFLLFIKLKSTDFNVFNYETANAIILHPIKNLEIRCYLILEDRLKLWLFLLDIRTPIKTLLDNKKISFERNTLMNIQYLRFHGSLTRKLIIRISKTETHFKIRITSFNYIEEISEIGIINDCFYRDLSLDAVYYEKYLEWFKNSLENDYPSYKNLRSFFIIDEKNFLKVINGSNCCSLF